MMTQQMLVISRDEILSAVKALAHAICTIPPAPGDYSIGFKDGYQAALLSVAVALGADEELKRVGK